MVLNDQFPIKFLKGLSYYLNYRALQHFLNNFDEKQNFECVTFSLSENLC